MRGDFDDDGRSHNTAEIARRSLARAEPWPDATWVLESSAFRMWRAMRSFAAAGWPSLVAWPMDHRSSHFAAGIGWNLTRNLRALNTVIREHVKQLAYKLTNL